MDVGRIRSSRVAGAALFCIAAVALGCAGEPAPGGGPGAGGQRSPAGVAGKPLIQTPAGPAIADELVVAFAEGTTPSRVEEVATSVGGQVAWRGPRTGAYLLRFQDAAAAGRARAELALREEVAEVARHWIARGTGIGTTPGLLDIQWNLWGMRLDPREDPGDAFGVVIGVLDTGAAYEDRTDATGTFALAPDLAETSFLPGWDFVDDDPHPNDDHGHGTHVTGIIAASSGITPLAAGADIMPIKVLDASNMGTELGLAEGILYAADSGADVVNMSLSFSPAFFPSRYLQSAVSRASEEGLLLVAAVGNHGGAGIPFPAAFRDVLAVGGSRLDEDYEPSGAVPTAKRWNTVPARGLEPAGYSNRGYLVDVVAPAGVIDRDADGDGNPEAIVAQTFAGDPTDFGYYLFAGTSQASAQVSAVAARILKESGSVRASKLRAHMGGSTLSSSGGNVFLDEALGRGFVNARASMERAGSSLSEEGAPRMFASIRLELVGDDVAPSARADVQILDADRRPAKRVWVYGTFTGGLHASVEGRTDRKGRLTFTSPELPAGAALAGFQVDAVAAKRRRAIVRPEGVLQIDSCSLERLAGFAGSLSDDAPVSLRAVGNPDTLQLLNFSHGLATAPMAVAVRPDWFYAEFPGAEAGTVVTSGGHVLGMGEDAFPIPVPPGDEDVCTDLVLVTFGDPLGDEAPISSDPGGDCGDDDVCAQVASLLAEMWQGTAPPYDPDLGISAELYDHLAAVVGAYAAFEGGPTASAVGSYGDVLGAAGVGLVPADGAEAEGAGVTGLSQ